MCRRVGVALGLLCLAACGGRGQDPDGGGNPNQREIAVADDAGLGRLQYYPPATYSCVDGWWLGAPVPCAQYIFCTHIPRPNAECTFSDCVAIDVEGFMGGGVMFATTLTWGAAERQFSVYPGPILSSWFLDSTGNFQFALADGGQYADMDRGLNGQCQGTSLLIDYSLWDKPTQPLTGALWTPPSTLETGSRFATDSAVAVLQLSRERAFRLLAVLLPVHALSGE